MFTDNTYSAPSTASPLELRLWLSEGEVEVEGEAEGSEVVVVAEEAEVVEVSKGAGVAAAGTTRDPQTKSLSSGKSCTHVRATWCAT